MNKAARTAAEVAMAAAGAAAIGFLLQQSRLYGRVRSFPDAVPGIEWKDVAAYAVPFLVLAWVFVVRRGATSSLVGVLVAAALVVGHAWSNLDWTIFFARGIDLARGGAPPPVILAGLLALFVLAALYHLVRRRSELARAYAAKGADPADVEAARRASARGGAAAVGGAALLAALAVGAVAAAGRVPAPRLPPLVGLALAVAAILGLGLALAVLPAWAARRRLPAARS